MRVNFRLLSKAPKGCKYLQELRFNPQCSGGSGAPGKISSVMPRVVAYTLRHLKCLRICDIDTGLAEGLQYYLHGPEGGYHPKMNRLDRLKLTYFHGKSDQLTEELFQVRWNYGPCRKYQISNVLVFDILPTDVY